MKNIKDYHPYRKWVKKRFLWWEYFANIEGDNNEDNNDRFVNVNSIHPNRVCRDEK